VIEARRPSVVIIDDEELVLRSYARILSRDYDVTAFSSALEALKRIAAGQTWDAILCDLQMPGLDAVEFQDRLLRLRPDLAARLAFITGGAFTERTAAFLEQNMRPVVEKPTPPEELRAAVRRMLT
jgi:CheY-like chemotaxis protein